VGVRVNYTIHIVSPCYAPIVSLGLAFYC
jgi:hypothetical protein